MLIPVDCGGCAPPVWVEVTMPVELLVAAVRELAEKLRLAAEGDVSNAGAATTLAEANRWQRLADAVDV